MPGPEAGTGGPFSLSGCRAPCRPGCGSHPLVQGAGGESAPTRPISMLANAPASLQGLRQGLRWVGT